MYICILGLFLTAIRRETHKRSHTNENTSVKLATSVLPHDVFRAQMQDCTLERSLTRVKSAPRVFFENTSNKYKLDATVERCLVSASGAGVLAKQEIRGLTLNATLVKSLSNSKPVTNISVKQEV